MTKRRSPLSDIAPSAAETAGQLLDGLRAFSLTTHAPDMIRMLVGTLPRHGLTPAAAILGAGKAWGDATGLTDNRGSLSYRQLAAATRRLAAALGGIIQPGDRVALMADDDRFLLIGLGAACLAGAKIWLVNPRMGSDHLTACLADNKITIVIHAPGCADRPSGFTGQLIPTTSFGRLASAVRPGTPVPNLAKHSKIVMLTSGTTAAPASIPIRRRWAAPLPSLALAGATKVRHGHPTLVCAPQFHGYGLACTMLCLVTGSPVVLSSALRAAGLAQMNKGGTGRLPWGEAIFEVADRERVHTIFGVPAHFASLSSYLTTAKPAAGRAQYVGAIVSGADRLDGDTIRTLQARWGPVVTNYYGTTESGTVTMITGKDLRRRPDSVGRPVAGSRLRIVNEQGTVLRRGTPGRIRLASPLASVGRASAWRSWFTTNDIGWVDADGYLYLAGRSGTATRMGGEFVDPSQVESVLVQSPQVVRAQVRVTRDPVMGQRLVAEVWSGVPVDTDELREQVRRRLGPAAVPESITVST